MRDGVRVLNVARGGLIDDAALKDALDSGKVAGAALDVFPSEPITDYPLFDGYPNVVVTPHLGASTAEATDRAGYQSAEQIVAALTGGVVSTAVNIPSIGAEDMEVLGPFLPLARQLGRLAMALAEGSSVERIEAAFLGRIADFDTRLLDARRDRRRAARAAPRSRSTSSTRRRIAEERGIVVEEKSVSEAQDFNELIRVTVVAGDERVAVAGTGIGPNQVPHLVEVQGRRLTIELEPHVTVFRYEDLPGHDRPRRHDLRRARHQHLLGRRRAHARRRAAGDDGVPGRAAARRDGRHDRRRRARRGRRRDRRLRRASSTAGPSTSAERPDGAS